MKTKREPRKERNTIAKQTRDLPLEKAIEYATYGRRLSDIEAAACHFLDFFFFERDHPQEIQTAGIIREAIREYEETLSLEVLRAVQNRDSVTLHELASMVARYDPDPVDQTRSLLLTMKRWSLHSGQGFTLKDLARMLHFPAGADLSRLRVTAKEIQFPLVRDKVGAPRRIEMRKRFSKPSKP